MTLIDRDRARELVFCFRDKKILVVGDAMLDQWIWGKVSRISPEAPVPVVDVDYLSFTPGGAANVVNNLCSLGAKVSMLSVVGDDENGKQLCNELCGRGVCVDSILSDESRPTTTKTRILANNQQVCRTDIEKVAPMSAELCGKLCDALGKELADTDLCVISDYNKGLLCEEFFRIVMEWQKTSGKMVVGGPKPVNISMFSGASLLTLNEKEAFEVAGTRQKNIETIGEELLAKYNLKALIITRGDKGMMLFIPRSQPFSIPALASEVFDVSGAGDTVLSVCSLALACGADFPQAMALSNFAAAVVVKKVGTATISVSELIDVIDRQQLVGKI